LIAAFFRMALLARDFEQRRGVAGPTLEDQRT
jgi:hypothetical protein